MAGTRAGGLKCAAKNKEKYGEEFYKRIGQKGGKIGHTGGFHQNRELAKLAGTLGGFKSCKGWKLIQEDGEFLWYRSTSNKYTSKMYMKKSFLSGKILYIGTEGPND